MSSSRLVGWAGSPLHDLGAHDVAPPLSNLAPAKFPTVNEFFRQQW